MPFFHYTSKKITIYKALKDIIFASKSHSYSSLFIASLIAIWEWPLHLKILPCGYLPCHTTDWKMEQNTKICGWAGACEFPFGLLNLRSFFKTTPPKKRKRKMVLAFLSDLPLHRSKKMTFHLEKKNSSRIKTGKGKNGYQSFFSFLFSSVLLRKTN